MDEILEAPLGSKQKKRLSTLVKPHLTFWQIWNMSFRISRNTIWICLAECECQPNISNSWRQYRESPSLLDCGSVTGMIVQPIIGYLSDRTWHPRWGRRRPYFFTGAVLATTALFIMPNSSVLWMAVGTLWMMDASINISMEPFRAFVGDKLPSEQRTTGFAMQTFFIGIGAVVASQLPYIFTNFFHISNEAAPGIISDSVKYSFYIGGTVFLSAVLWTVFTTNEFPPESIETFEAENSVRAAC